MTEKTHTPGMARFNPIRQFMLLQRYGQNHPWKYMLRVTLLVTVYGAVLLALCFAPIAMFGDAPLSQVWPWMLAALAGLAACAALGAGVGVLMLKWTTKEAKVPHDVDPDTLRSAQRHLRRGELSGDPQLDRLARHLAPQSERANSNRFFVLAFLLAGVPYLVFTGIRFANGTGDTFQLSMALFIIVVFAVAWPWARKHKRNAQRLRKAYDAEYGPFDGETSSHRDRSDRGNTGAP
jgi:drug/metabolite transporter (DMT)-like permease